MTGFGKDGRGVILYMNGSEGLSTLGANSVHLLETYAIKQDFRMLRMDLWVQMRGMTAGDGPILIGLADAGLTEAEIKFALEASPTAPDDYPEIEATHRPIYPLVYMDEQVYIPVGGLPLSWDKRWTFDHSEDLGWVLWAYNHNAAPMTTGTVVKHIAKIYGVWVK